MDILPRGCILFCISVWISIQFLHAANLDCEVGCAPKWTIPESSTNKIPRMLGESVSFRCPTEGKPRPDVTWLKDGHLIQSQNKKVQMGEVNLVVKHLAMKDSGVYTCIVENIHGRINRVFHLAVYRSRIDSQSDDTASPKNVTVTEGQTAYFECAVQGEAGRTFTVKWVKERSVRNGKDEKSNNQNRLLLKHELNDGVNRLDLLAVNLADSGRYTCIIKSAHTTREKSAWLKVLPANADDISGPRVSSVYDGAGETKATRRGGLVTYFKGVGISLGAMAGLLGLGFLIVCAATIYRAVRKFDQQQERP